MTSFKFKGWVYVLNLSFLILLLLFCQSLGYYLPIVSSSGQENQQLYFSEDFEELSSYDLLFEEFNFEGYGDVPYGITSESAHTGSNSFFVGPSTCGGFCFGDFTVKTTITSLNLTDAKYFISYWRRESFDFGGTIQIRIDEHWAYDENVYDGEYNTGKDTGWYHRFFFFTGEINSLTFWETDLTDTNTIYLDDIVIRNGSNFDDYAGVTQELNLDFSKAWIVLGFISTIVITIIIIKLRKNSWISN